MRLDFKCARDFLALLRELNDNDLRFAGDLAPFAIGNSDAFTIDPSVPDAQVIARNRQGPIRLFDWLFRDEAARVASGQEATRNKFWDDRKGQKALTHRRYILGLLYAVCRGRIDYIGRADAGDDRSCNVCGSTRACFQFVNDDDELLLQGACVPCWITSNHSACSFHRGCKCPLPSQSAFALFTDFEVVASAPSAAEAFEAGRELVRQEQREAQELDARVHQAMSTAFEDLAINLTPRRRGDVRPSASSPAPRLPSDSPTPLRPAANTPAPRSSSGSPAPLPSQTSSSHASSPPSAFARFGRHWRFNRTVNSPSPSVASDFPVRSSPLPAFGAGSPLGGVAASATPPVRSPLGRPSWSPITVDSPQSSLLSSPLSDLGAERLLASILIPSNSPHSPGSAHPPASPSSDERRRLASQAGVSSTGSPLARPPVSAAGRSPEDSPLARRTRSGGRAEPGFYHPSRGSGHGPPRYGGRGGGSAA
jgi:hypothetical protein